LNTQTPNESGLLDIGYGLKIGVAASAAWQVWGKSGCFKLTEISDFYRVVTLLERSYSEVESMLSDYAKRISAPSPFPLWKVVGAGLAFQSDQWASLALAWFPYLKQSEKTTLIHLLKDVAHSQWASQKNRQLADRYSKPA
jgi:hypothetical protein